MSSSTMPPPPSPLAHRRTKPGSVLVNSPSCIPRKMSLSKADTFHQPSSPSTEDDPVLSVAHLSKRSTTYTRSSFASWLYSGRDTAADVIADFEQTFSGARGSRPAARRRSAREFEDSLLSKTQHRASSPVDSGLGSSIGSPSEKSLSRKLDKALDLTSNKDSALGGSVSGSVRAASEHLIQDANATKPRSTISRSSDPAPLTIIRYIAPAVKKDSLPLLSTIARRQIYKRLFAPLLQKARFEEFRPIVAGTRKNKHLRCLRDIEQSLINQPVTLTVTPSLYRAFSELTIQLVIDTYQHLSESEQRRPTDRAYDNGYFLDLVQQVQQLAAHIGSSNTSVEDGTAPTLDDEVTLEGGLAESGQLAELVRWKNGEGISLRTGLPYVPMAGMKRTASSMDSHNADLSMARRKKGVEYPIIDMPCSVEDCDKIFNRKCDLSKHEKTHSRPYKCRIDSCKYFKQGLPTEKELDRHMNDKHNAAPKMYKCEYCEFQTKRESNCKQHMEKKHGWTYQRSKGKDKATDLTPAATPMTRTSSHPSIHQSPAMQPYIYDKQSPFSSNYNESPYQQVANDFGSAEEYPTLFPKYQSSAQVNETCFDFNGPLTLNTSVNNQFGTYPTPESVMMQHFTPRTPAYSNITPSPAMMSSHSVEANYHGVATFPTPESNHSHSRHASNAHIMPMAPDMELNDMIMDAGDDFAAPEMDFALNFNDSMYSSAFTHANAGNVTLFPDVAVDQHDQTYTPEQFEAVGNMDMQFDENAPFDDTYMNY